MNNHSIFRPQILTTRLLTTAVVGILALAAGFALANGPSARAAMEKVGLLQTTTIEEHFNYQGFLREADGSPTTGVKNITSKIYHNAATGGTAIHTQMFNDVNVRDGLFNIVIGDGVPLVSIGDQTPVFDKAPLYIGISVSEVGAQGTGTELIPRERIHSVPWATRAIKAQTAGHASSADSATYAQSAGFATTAEDIVPGAITATTHGSGTLPFDTRDLSKGACFLTRIANTGGDSDSCMIVENTLSAGGDALCYATCIGWGE